MRLSSVTTTYLTVTRRALQVGIGHMLQSMTFVVATV